MRIKFIILAVWLGLVFTVPASTNYLTTGAGTPSANGYFYPLTNGIYAGTNAFILSGAKGSVLSYYAQPSATNDIIYFPHVGPPLYFAAPTRGSSYAPRTNYGGTNILTFYTAPSTTTNTVTNWPALLEYHGNAADFSVVLTLIPTDTSGNYVLGNTNFIVPPGLLEYPAWTNGIGNIFYIQTRSTSFINIGSNWRLNWPRGNAWRQFALNGSTAGVTNPPAGEVYFTEQMINPYNSGNYDAVAFVTTLGPVTNSQKVFIAGSRVIFNLNGTLLGLPTATSYATNGVVLFSPPQGLYFNANGNPASGYWITTGGTGRAPKLTQFAGPNPYASTNVTELWQTNKPATGGEPLFRKWLETNPPIVFPSGLNFSFALSNGVTLLFTNGILMATNSPQALGNSFSGNNFFQAYSHTIDDGSTLDIGDSEISSVNGTYTASGNVFANGGYFVRWNGGGWIIDDGSNLFYSQYNPDPNLPGDPSGSYGGTGAGCSVGNFAGNITTINEVNEDRFSWTDLSSGAATFTIKFNGSTVWTGTGASYSRSHSSGLYEIFESGIKFGQVSL